MHSHGSSRTGPDRHEDFVPAAGVDWLLPLYDPLCRLLGTHRYRERLLDAAAIRPGERVLDLGCGTGALSLQLYRRHPDARLTGLDPDPHALARARAKAAREGAPVEWQQGFGDALPFADGGFDRVVSSLVFHHLTHDGRRATLAEIARVLAPGGRLLVLDFGPPHGALDRLLLHLFHRDDRLEDNLAGRIPALMADAGLAEPREAARMRSPFGSLAIWEAAKR
jgi:ubiquinone/menaquinone biosynthesis C-methylase UbiE